MTRPAARRAAVLLSSVLLAAVLIPLVGVASAATVTCPVDSVSGSLDYDLFVIGEPVAGLAGNVEPGDLVVAVVTVPDGCPEDGDGVEVTLANYAAPSPTFEGTQVLVDSQSALLEPGEHRLQVVAASPCFQVDLAFGRPLPEVSPQQRYGDRLLEAANGGTEPCGEPEIPRAECPALEGSRADLVDALDPRYSSGGVTGNHLDDVVQPGEPVTVDFTVPAACAGIELTLASYTASGPTFPSDQVVYEYETDTFAAGPGSLSVLVPDCYYQVDFARGPVIEDLERERYGRRLIDADNGGSEPCDTIVVPGPEETTTPGPVETTTPGPVETTTPGPEETTTPGPEETTTPGPDETTTPGPEETTTPAPVETTPAPGGPIVVVSPDETEAAPTTPAAPAAPTTPAAPIVAPAVPIVAPAPAETPSLGVVPDTPTIVTAPDTTALAVTGLPVPVLAALSIASLVLGVTLLSLACRRA